MKKTLLVTLLLIPFLGIAQTTKPIDGFLGIKFGVSKADVIAAVKAKGGILNANGTDDQITFREVKLGKRASLIFSVDFINGKAYSAVFTFKPDQDPQTIEYYNALIDDINGVYGPGKPYKAFKSPYKDGDGDEITALRGGYADFFTNWETDTALMQAKISTVDDELYVALIYQSKALAAEAAAKEKEKAKSDF